jgi:NAD(P)-dependent dehydrogenase (short-subunit alcohol dehydrogenase family)
MSTFDNKIVLVTGAKGGLGASVTEAFLDARATVIGVSRSIEASDFPNAKFAAMPADLSSGESAQALVGAVIARFQRIDVLAHLVGGFAGGKPIAETGDATFERMFDMNVKSALHMARAVVPHMRRQRSGRILAIGSRAAAEPQAMAGAYSAAKAALVSLVRTLAAENKDMGITANVILAGTMDTAANRSAMPDADFAKWVQPGQVAAMLVHLASDMASQVNGAVIPIYGE